MNVRNKFILKYVMILISLVMFAAAMEFEARLFWSLGYNVPFFGPDRILYAYYKEMIYSDKVKPTRIGEYFNILLLGGSVLNKRYGQVEKELINQFTKAGYSKIRIFNLAEDAHTSRDSLLKYKALDKARFDMVIFYHGINDTRSNNSPPEIFRDDYGHYSWYEQVNCLALYHGNTHFALPYTLHYIYIRIMQALNRDRYVPLHTPNENWTRYGHNLRSVAAFRKNLNSFLALASIRNDKIFLMTFATVLSKEDLAYIKNSSEKSKEYAEQSRNFHLWGLPENVLAGVDAQNEVIRNMVEKHNHILFVDQAKLMTGISSYFSDSCHFTDAGSEKFVQNIIEAVIKAQILPVQRTDNALNTK